MNDTTHDDHDEAERKRKKRHDFSMYAWGYGLAIVLTLVPFGLVNWKGSISQRTLFYVIGAFALVQMVVHFRFFLHLGLHRRREDLQLIAFSALLLTILVGGTLWIMMTLAMRMTLPMMPPP